jgi:SAM-dependent methyltransferase
MDIDNAIISVQNIFPFKGYMDDGVGKYGVYASIANAVCKYLKPGSKILDFGCGPCDKTAVLQLLGYKCTGYDDLQDDWHLLKDNQNKIISFASQVGIDFRHVTNNNIELKKDDLFDMIMLNDVIEHLHNSPRYLLTELLSYLKPHGLLFITVPNAATLKWRLNIFMGKSNYPRFNLFYWGPGSWRGHIREYVKDDFLQLNDYLNLELLLIKGCDHRLQFLPSQRLMKLYLVITGMFPSLKDSWIYIASKRENWSVKKELGEDDLVKVIGRSTPYHE